MSGSKPWLSRSATLHASSMYVSVPSQAIGPSTRLTSSLPHVYRRRALESFGVANPRSLPLTSQLRYFAFQSAERAPESSARSRNLSASMSQSMPSRSASARCSSEGFQSAGIGIGFLARALLSLGSIYGSSLYRFCAQSCCAPDCAPPTCLGAQWSAPLAAAVPEA